MTRKKAAKKAGALVVNLYGGPGSRKSTVMAHVFAELKWEGVNAEQGPEFAKEKVWEKSFDVLRNQIYVFGKQLHTIVRVHEQVEVIVSDSPLLLSLYYGKHELPEFRDLVKAVYRRYRTLNVFLTRSNKYNPSGRMQTESEARGIDKAIKKLLDENGIPYVTVAGVRESVPLIVNMVLEALGRPKMGLKMGDGKEDNRG